MISYMLFTHLQFYNCYNHHNYVLLIILHMTRNSKYCTYVVVEPVHEWDFKRM